ncbi:MAG TPA: SCO family protein [Streptosporangiaceae bacterium]|jgi:cytochrome oxidase Cu insertion factor (SCO1/SenC/PrrC family)
MNLITERFPAHRSLWALILVPLALALAIAGCSAAPPGTHQSTTAGRSNASLTANPAVDPGSPLGGKPAPGFTLLDQNGQKVSLSQFHGKAVLISFVDSHCTTICPLTTTSLLQAVSLLGPAGKQVQLLGIDANPQATRVSDVHAYSVAHNMMQRWDFLTGTLAQLKQVWKDYHVYVQAIRNNIDHEPAIYLITPGGHEQSIFLTQMAYTATDQQAQVLANATAAVLPGHPHVKQSVSLRYIPGIKPATATELPVAGGRAAGHTIPFGPGHAHLVVFFATWVDENSNLTAELQALNAYQREALAHGWPQVVAVDEASTETTPSALPTFLSSLHGSLTYPVVIDKYGALSDGYGVQDQPWFELLSPTGKILFTNDGWLPGPSLTAAVRKAVSS